MYVVIYYLYLFKKHVHHRSGVFKSLSKRIVFVNTLIIPDIKLMSFNYLHLSTFILLKVCIFPSNYL